MGTAEAADTEAAMFIMLFSFKFTYNKESEFNSKFTVGVTLAKSPS